MNNIQIEKFAVQAVENMFLSRNNMVPYIDSNDKYPTWDGEVICYKSAEIRKDNIKGRIPLQVKGQKVNDFTSGSSRTFPCDIADLKNFKNDDGAMYFVVEVKSPTEQKVFLAKFLPEKLNNILKDAEKKGNKSSISCKFSYITNQSISNTCLSFMKNRDIQKSNIVVGLEELVNDNKIEKMHIVADMSGERDNTIININETYVYAHLRDIDKLVTIGSLSNFLGEYDLQFGIVSEVYINGKRYVNKIYNGLSKDNPYIKIDSFIKIYEDEKTDEGHIEWKFNGMLSDINNTLKFMNDILNSESFRINNKDIKLSKIIDVSNPNFEDLKTNICGLYQFYKNLRELLYRFNIKEDIPITGFSDEELTTLNDLIGYFLYGRKINISNKYKDPSFISLIEIKIGDILFVVYGVKMNGISEIYPVFKESIFNRVYKGIDKVDGKNNIELKIEGVYISEFLTLKKDILCEKYNGFDSGQIIKDINYYEITDGFILAMNGFILELIKAYDDCKKEELLILASDLIEKIREIEKLGFYLYMNELQIKKRMGNLEKEDIFRLAREYENTEDIATKIGIDVLMDDKQSADKHFSKMSQEDRELYKDYPIYNLYKKLTLKR